MYALTDSFCDRLSRALKDRKYPFRFGGVTQPGDKGCQHKFPFACILQSNLSVYRSQSQEEVGASDTLQPREVPDFQAYCYTLANELLTYTVALPS